MTRRGIPKEQLRLELPLTREEQEKLREQKREQARMRKEQRQYWRTSCRGLGGNMRELITLNM